MTDTSASLLGPLFATGKMRAIFTDRQRLQSMLDFEAALARALARSGIAPKTAPPSIESQCKAELFNIEALGREAALAGNVAIPMVKALTALVAAVDEKAMGFVHWGATSQDAIDTGTVLQLRRALALLDEGLVALLVVLNRIVETHKSTLLAGRTWLQQGPPITFGLKAAGWLGAIERDRARLSATQSRALVLQFGGAVGTLAALGDRGVVVAKALGEELNLEVPNVPWHAQRDRFAEVATTIGLLVGSLGKIARDLSLLAQTEVGELSEPSAPGRGGSSTMPHKRNPVGCAVALTAAIRVPGMVSTMLTAMVQEHERGLGGWQAEWETLPEICLLSSGALEQITHVLDGMEIHTAKMIQNLDITRGLVVAEAVTMALGNYLGRLPAHHLVESACRRAVDEDRSLLDVLLKNNEVRAHLSEEELKKLLDPRNYLGSTGQMIKAALSGSKISKTE
jgi:3-carboxy-cis,cis-muconate cycloisomerase